PGEPQVPVALTGPPDGGFVAPQLSGEVFSPLAGSNTQDNSGTSNLKPGRCVAVSDPLQFRAIWRGDRQHLRPASTHGSISHVDTGQSISIAGCSNSVQVFVPRTLACRDRGCASRTGPAVRHSSRSP